MSTTLRPLIMLTLCVAASQVASPAAAAMCESTSGTQVLPLVELYTSEGCSSCPPADKWLSTRFPVGVAQASVLAFHVDYWDRLGWKDRFASPRFTERQYAAMRAGGESFVYTPQVRVQGKDLRNWGGGAAQERIAALRPLAARAEVKLAVNVVASDVVEAGVAARVAEQTLQKHAQLWLAYTDSDLISNVKSGENRGERLAHDHVVRALAGPYTLDAQGRLDTRVRLARPVESGRRATLVAFVQDARNGEVLQTVSLPVCGVP